MMVPGERERKETDIQSDTQIQRGRLRLTHTQIHILIRNERKTHNDTNRQKHTH